MNKVFNITLKVVFVTSFTLGVAYSKQRNVDEPTSLEVPPVAQLSPDEGNDINTPITGSGNSPSIPSPDIPPSLEKLMAVRPGHEEKTEEQTDRDKIVKEAGLVYGARGGLAARNYAINEMLRNYETVLDRTYDFRSLVLPAGNGETLIRPPVVTEADMSVALSLSGQDARETSLIYKINQEASFVSALPQWRNYLVRSVIKPSEPNDFLRPRTAHEANIWRKSVAEGWAEGERQSVEIFLNDLSRLERDIIGMARYHVLLKAGKIQPPKITHRYQHVQGGHNLMRISDTSIHIEQQPGLDSNKAHWRSVGEER